MKRRLRPSLQRIGAAVVVLALAACGGGGGGSSSPGTRAVPTPVATATPNASASATAAPINTAAYTCPTSATNGVAQFVGGGVANEATVRHAAVGTRGAASTGTTTSGATTLLAVRYTRSTAQAMGAALQTRELSAGATFVRSYDFANANAVVHVVSVPTSQVAATESALRTQSGFVGVSVTGQKRYATSVTTPYFTNDPYFAGFTAAQNQAAQGLNVSTQSPAPYEETAKIPGQWDMHAIGLEYAFGYSQPGNGSNYTNTNALGSSSVKLAIIDTGEDQTHPELKSKIVTSECFITSPQNGSTPAPQSTGVFTTDEDGHGTDVSGIALADLNNGLGFVGAGGNVSLMAYRVFPTPDDNCTNDSTTDDQCTTDTADIASAINDAVSQKANVISMSLGGGACVTPSANNPGGDNDLAEGTAVENAIKAGVIVVAAAGNSGSSSAGVDAPACDTGVIAVGASALDDGAANGSGGGGNAGGTSTSPKEYVASYSQYGAAGQGQYRSTSAWGIVAPGGDPTGANDQDDVHWIDNIWTSTPYVGAPGDTNFIGECTPDYPSGGSPTNPGTDCRTLIAGTSMATPHVAGAAALILSATGGAGSVYASPTKMFQLLCQTTDNIPGNEGCGRLNVYRALGTALGDTVP